MWTLRAEGASLDQGLLQGRAAQTAIRRASQTARRRAGWFRWLRECARAKRLTLRPTERFLPQLAEREYGIALGAELAPSALALIARLQRIHANGRWTGSNLFGGLDAGSLGEALLFRISRPDHVGLQSVELTAPAWAGCWAGVNEAGVAVLVLQEFGGPGPRAALYAQDFLFRASSAASGISHLKLRADYAGGSGSFLVSDLDGDAFRLELVAGRLEFDLVAPVLTSPAAAQVSIDLAKRALRYRNETASL